MKIFVIAKPKSKMEKVEKVSDNIFRVSVKAPATDGLANAAIINLLAAYFGKRKSAVRIISGHSSKKKRIEIDPHT
ncbi:MAG: DUF167 domain-containing protein [Candidatus Wolfebacteria bacterium]|nr:DUF167 domain-containing protein [Candidatus Wolfebacteria bacterium]